MGCTCTPAGVELRFFCCFLCARLGFLAGVSTSMPLSCLSGVSTAIGVWLSLPSPSCCFSALTTLIGVSGVTSIGASFSGFLSFSGEPSLVVSSRRNSKPVIKRMSRPFKSSLAYSVTFTTERGFRCSLSTFAESMPSVKCTPSEMMSLQLSFFFFI